MDTTNCTRGQKFKPTTEFEHAIYSWSGYLTPIACDTDGLMSFPSILKRFTTVIGSIEVVVVVIS